MAKVTDLPHNQPTRLKNLRCAYCSASFKDGKPEKEHVIGKNFVPRGSHHQQWNLHVNSCHSCNQIKSQLENDLSAITMLQVTGVKDGLDDNLAGEAKRKSKTISQRTKKPVHDSTESIKITQQLGTVMSMTFGLTAAPQADEKRMFRLARFQLAGFFYCMSYNYESQLGECWPGAYMPLGALHKQDWGNPNIVSFAEQTADWTFCFGGTPTSNGYFQALIKRPSSKPIWSWALEWNKQYRIYGFFGDEVLGKEVITTLDWPERSAPIIDGDATYRLRSETPLSEETKDMFFHFNDPSL